MNMSGVIKMLVSDKTGLIKMLAYFKGDAEVPIKLLLFFAF